MSTFLLFFTCSSPLPDLHSFPTRRSSDLDNYDRLKAALDRLQSTTVATSIRQPLQRRRHRDRKSTRLNSSHQIISYAVFCLKKKKRSAIREQPARSFLTSLTRASLLPTAR